MPIGFFYRNTPYRLIKRKQLRNWILLITFLKKKEVDTIDYIFCDDEFLYELNRRYLSHSTFTDVITFDYSDGKSINVEIYISIDRVRENAKYYEVSFDEELRRVMVHGLLHCFGYTDKKIPEQKRMRNAENKLLKLFESVTS
jgi:probable rRNA maturation factor